MSIEPWRNKDLLVHAETVYDVAYQAGLTTAQVDWVAIYGARTISWSDRLYPDVRKQHGPAPSAIASTRLSCALAGAAGSQPLTGAPSFAGLEGSRRARASMLAEEVGAVTAIHSARGGMCSKRSRSHFNNGCRYCCCLGGATRLEAEET